jgi:glutamate synthase domain-containing protein 3
MGELDLSAVGLREVNRQLQSLDRGANDLDWRIVNPKGAHAIAVGLDIPARVLVAGHAGFYCGGMGHAGPGVGENMMSGTIRVTGNASQSAGASGQGGLLVVEGDTSSRCGISMKGIDIVVGGSVGHMSAFMAQSGHLVVCGDAGRDLGDSIYEARIFVRGAVESLGADCVEKAMGEEHLAALAGLLARAGIEADAADFRRYGSARRLYNFDVDHADFY